MTLFKHEFPNGNTFIWLGKGPTWGKGPKDEGIDNVLILSGGEVLFLRTAKILPLYENEVMEDIKNLKYRDFKEKYDLSINSDLWRDLKEGVKSGKYLSFLSKPKK